MSPAVSRDEQTAAATVDGTREGKQTQQLLLSSQSEEAVLYAIFDLLMIFWFGLAVSSHVAVPFSISTDDGK